MQVSTRKLALFVIAARSTKSCSRAALRDEDDERIYLAVKRRIGGPNLKILGWRFVSCVTRRTGTFSQEGLRVLCLNRDPSGAEIVQQ
jgi:hypothetical protein